MMMQGMSRRPAGRKRQCPCISQRAMPPGTLSYAFMFWISFCSPVIRTARGGQVASRNLEQSPFNDLQRKPGINQAEARNSFRITAHWRSDTRIVCSIKIERGSSHASEVWSRGGGHTFFSPRLRHLSPFPPLQAAGEGGGDVRYLSFSTASSKMVRFF
jgi:hypothetical protein